MILTLQRRPSFKGATIGELLHQGDRISFTLEDQIRQVPGRPVAEWKVHGQTAIPVGRYRITLETSPRFGPNTLTVWGVEGFTGVRIHGGNRHEDTEGCPLLGLHVTDRTIVGGASKPAVELVKRLVASDIAAGNEVWLDIMNPRAA
ncbi:MAG: DUF5675 family protein [Pseudomonadota bacterium]